MLYINMQNGMSWRVLEYSKQPKSSSSFSKDSSEVWNWWPKVTHHLLYPASERLYKIPVQFPSLGVYAIWPNEIIFHQPPDFPEIAGEFPKPKRYFFWGPGTHVRSRANLTRCYTTYFHHHFPTFPPTFALISFTSLAEDLPGVRKTSHLEWTIERLVSKSWVVPPPSNSGKWRFIGIPY